MNPLVTEIFYFALLLLCFYFYEFLFVMQVNNQNKNLPLQLKVLGGWGEEEEMGAYLPIKIFFVQILDLLFIFAWVTTRGKSVYFIMLISSWLRWRTKYSYFEIGNVLGRECLFHL